MIHGIYEQQDLLKGLKTITATYAAFSPFTLRWGEMFSQSQVFVGGNSKKSRETIIRSITTTQPRVRNLTFQFTVSYRQSLIF
jgi:hypothetical protein